MVYGTQSINESVGCVAHKVYNKLNVKGNKQITEIRKKKIYVQYFIQSLLSRN